MRRRAWPIVASIAIHGGLGAWIATRPSTPLPPAEQRAQTFAPTIARIVERGPAMRSETSGEPGAPKAKTRRANVPADKRAQGQAVESGGEARATGDNERAATDSDPSIGSVEAPREINLALEAPAPPDPEVSRAPSLPRSNAVVPGIALQPNGGGSYRYRDPEFDARIGSDGTLELEDRELQFRMPDATDALMRLAGDDPYAYEKRKFMEATRGLRNQMADAACIERLDESVLDMRPRLEAIWKSDRSLAEKKNRIFALWDECAEEGSPQVLRTSKVIREVIYEFIAEKLPAVGPHAYTPGELALLNERRHSREIFAPYISE